MLGPRNDGESASSSAVKYNKRNLHTRALKDVNFVGKYYTKYAESCFFFSSRN